MCFGVIYLYGVFVTVIGNFVLFPRETDDHGDSNTFVYRNSVIEKSKSDKLGDVHYYCNTLGKVNFCFRIRR